MFALNKLVRILDWLQRLIILYSSGEDAIPREMKVAMQRFKSNEVSDGREVFYCKCIGVDTIDARYIFSINSGSIPFDNRIFPGVSYTQETCTFIVTKKYSCVHDMEQSVIFDKDTSHIIIFVPVEVLKADNVELTVKYCVDLIVELMYKDSNNLFEEAKLKVIVGFFQFAFIMGIFNGDEYEKFWNFDNADLEPKIFTSVHDYIQKNYDFSNTSLIAILNDAVTKFEDGDTDFWGNMTAGIEWRNILPYVPEGSDEDLDNAIEAKYPKAKPTAEGGEYPQPVTAMEILK